MKRFKTKQEFKREFGKFWRSPQLGGQNSFVNQMDCYCGLIPNKCSWEVEDWMLTDSPHPFDTMDIKVRVTPKQCRKLVKKTEKLGYVKGNGLNSLTDGSAEFIHTYGKKIHWMTSHEEYFNDGNETELTYKQFMNGTVPKKKEFKVGDWVEAKHYHTGQIHIGEIEDIDSYFGIKTANGCYFACSKSTAKHTTKPKEQPLMFKGYEVRMSTGCGGELLYDVGCKEFHKRELESFLDVYDKASPDATPNEVYDFIKANKEKLGL